MIRLNADGKLLQSPGSWDEVFSLPGFVASVDKSTHKLKEILGQYAIPEEKQSCGLQGCRTPHNRGYIVLVGDEGEVTNIGNVCGKNHFGVDFQESKNRFNQAVNAQRFRQNISEKQFHVDDLLHRLELLGAEDVKDTYRKMHHFMTGTLDEKTSRALKERARRKNAQVTRSVRITEDEREFDLGLRSDARFRDELIFTISGVEAPLTYARLSPRKLNSIRDEITAFAEVDADSTGYMDLKRHNRWASRIDKRLEDLDEIVVDCRRFLTGENINAIIKAKSAVASR